MIKGKCHCQTVKYESSNDSESAVFCHCQTCREINGSAFGSSAVVPRKGFEIISGQKSLVGYESSSGKKRFFCSNCGTHVYATSSKKPENIILRIGCIDGNHNIVPTHHIWTSQKASWYEISENIPMHEEWRNSTIE